MLNDVPMTTPARTLGAVINAMRRGVKLWEDAHIVTAEVPLHAAAVDRILPWGLRAVLPHRGTIFVAHYPKAAFTCPYLEAALLIHVRSVFGRGVHCAWMAVDDDTAMIYGRELLGYPKKMATFDYNGGHEKVHCSVSRREMTPLRVEAARGARESLPCPIMGVKTYNVGGPGQLWLLQPIWMFRPKEVILESFKADVRFQIDAAPHDPLDELVAGEAENGRMATVDIIGSHYNLLVGYAGYPTFVNRFELAMR